MSIIRIVIVAISVFVFNPLSAFFSKCQAESCILPENTLLIEIGGPDYSRQATWSGDNIKFQDRKYEYNESTNRFVFTPVDRSSLLPQYLSNNGLILSPPFSFSNDNSLLIFAVYTEDILRNIQGTNNVVLVNIKDNAIIGPMKFNKYVSSVQWSDSGRYVAILLNEIAKKSFFRTIIEYPADFLGHPISYTNFTVAVYDKEGKFVCEKNIVQKVRYGTGYFVGWK